MVTNGYLSNDKKYSMLKMVCSRDRKGGYRKVDSKIPVALKKIDQGC